MREILCVLDFTESSGKVLEVAARIANGFQAHLYVLSPYRLIDSGYEGNVGSLKSKLEGEAREKFNELKKNLPNMGNLSCEFQPEIGFMADRINAHVRKRTIEMVIIGQQQAAAAASDMKGFNLQQLISNSELPFVIVPSAVKAAVANI